VKNGAPKPRWALPYEASLPAEPAGRRRATVARIAVYAAAVALFVTPTIQFQAGTMKNLRKARAFDLAHPNWTPADAAAGGPQRPKAHKGAIGRWRKAIRAFWAGENIYRGHGGAASGEAGRIEAGRPEGRSVWLHPNMPFVVMLLTPFAYLPVAVMAAGWSALKLLVLVAAILMAAAVARDRSARPPDWVIALAVLWSAAMIVDDIRHGNTNVLVLGVLALHLWLYRRGRDGWSGAALALAVCLKMTPALFLLYWLQQRNWKLLAGAFAGLAVFVALIPLVVLGPGRYATLGQSYLENLIVPGLLKNAWYPVHINQSVSGVFSRYFLAEGRAGGNIFWNPDDNPYAQQEEFGWITLVALPPWAVRLLIRCFQAAIVGLGFWAIGWRKLPRDDGRRALHYALVVTAMLLLNQRTWEHHAAILLIADVALWQGIAFGRVSRAARAWSLGLVLGAGAVFWAAQSGLVEGVGRLLGRSDEQAETLADVVKAYGPGFYHFVLLFAAAVVLAVALRKTDVPYARQRQRLLR